MLNPDEFLGQRNLKISGKLVSAAQKKNDRAFGVDHRMKTSKFYDFLRGVSCQNIANKLFYLGYIIFLQLARGELYFSLVISETTKSIKNVTEKIAQHNTLNIKNR